MLRKYDCIDALMHEGITYDDACALRRISMTLHRWHELECGDSNAHASWCITRGSQQPEGFVYDDEGAPFNEIHWNKRPTQYVRVPDRERGALKRLAKIMARYPGFASYVQGDPRGCALYIIPPAVVDWHPVNQPVDDYYTRGIAVHK